MTDPFDMTEENWDEEIRNLGLNLVVLVCPECEVSLPFDKRKFVPGYEIVCSGCGFSQTIEGE